MKQPAIRAGYSIAVASLMLKTAIPLACRHMIIDI
jgi:hypothetical protein